MNLPIADMLRRKSKQTEREKQLIGLKRYAQAAQIKGKEKKKKKKIKSKWYLGNAKRSIIRKIVPNKPISPHGKRRSVAPRGNLFIFYP
jgi:hypothetical protein